MKAVSIFATLVLSACSQQSGADKQDEIARRVAENRLRDNPAGAYQMVAAKGGEDIFLLDTRNGVLRRCWFGTGNPLTVSCGDPSAPAS